MSQRITSFTFHFLPHVIGQCLFLVNLQEQSPKRCFDAPFLREIDFYQALLHLKKVANG